MHQPALCIFITLRTKHNETTCTVTHDVYKYTQKITQIRAHDFTSYLICGTYMQHTPAADTVMESLMCVVSHSCGHKPYAIIRFCNKYTMLHVKFE